MNEMISRIAPLMFIALSLQLFIEAFDPFFKFLTEKCMPFIYKGAVKNATKKEQQEHLTSTKKKVKGTIIRIFSISLALAISLYLDLRILNILALKNAPRWIDFLVTAFAISGGTEGFNSTLKFISVSKEVKGKAGK